MAKSETHTMDDQLYGDHETQVSEGGEADLHKHLIDCKKNPGHTQFIPVHTFTLNHLPEGHRDIDVYKLIKLTADLTVRVCVKMTSPHRPEFWSDTKVLYPFYNMRDKTNLRIGSGTVSVVYKFTDGRCDQYGYTNRYGDTYRKEYKTCWCKKCLDSDTPSQVWWEFDVATATHVVFDDIEASHTSLRLFYDREDSPNVILDQVSIYDVNIEYDLCRLKCVTCDNNLGDKLDMLYRNYEEVWRGVWSKYRETRNVNKICLIVSHPHGCSKQVSVGRWLQNSLVGEFHTKFSYTTCTCPGSSGAKVHFLGQGGGVWWENKQPVHSGSLNSKHNCSGAGEIW